MEKTNLSTPFWEFKEGSKLYVNHKRKGASNHTTELCEVVENFGTRVKVKHGNGEEKLHNMTSCGLFGEHPVTKHESYHWFKHSGYAVYPSEFELGSENGEVISEHPSYGMIGINRTTGRQVLFGTSIEHFDFFTLRIGTATHKRSLSTDWYSKKKDLIEVRISATQFMDMITGMNRGDGVPCTISYMDRICIPEPPFISKVDLYNQEFKNKMRKVTEPLEAQMELIQDILSKKSVTKGDKEEILSILNNFRNTISDQVPFVQKTFTEQIGQTITEAKAEVESFVSNRISEAGLEALRAKSGGSILIENLGENGGAIQEG